MLVQGKRRILGQDLQNYAPTSAHGIVSQSLGLQDYACGFAGNFLD